MYMTGEILLQLSENHTMEEVLRLIPKSYVSYQAGKYKVIKSPSRTGHKYLIWPTTSMKAASWNIAIPILWLRPKRGRILCL